MKTTKEMIGFLKDNYGELELSIIAKGISVKKKAEPKKKEIDFLKIATSIIGRGSKIRPVINGVYCKDNISIATDLDNTLIVNKNIAGINGVYLPEQIKNNACSISMDLEDFPNIKPLYDGLKVKINKEGIDKVIWFASKSSDNLSVNCVRIEAGKGEITYLATDTYRLTKKIYEYSGQDFAISIPLKCAEIISKYFNNEEIEVVIDGNKIMFTQGEIVLLSRLIELSYPNVKNMSFSFDREVMVNTKELISKLKEVAEIAKNDTEHKHKIKVTSTKDKLIIKAISNTMKKEVELDCICNTNDVLNINLNCQFFISCIDTEQETSKILFGGRNSAVMIGESLQMPLAYSE